MKTIWMHAIHPFLENFLNFNSSCSCTDILTIMLTKRNKTDHVTGMPAKSGCNHIFLFFHAIEADYLIVNLDTFKSCIHIKAIQLLMQFTDHVFNLINYSMK